MPYTARVYWQPPENGKADPLCAYSDRFDPPVPIWIDPLIPEV